MRKTFKRCIIHIGTEKTGTSAIQQYFENNREAYIHDGVLYPKLGNGGSQWELVAISQPEPWNDAGLSRNLKIDDAESRDAFRDELTGKLDKQFAKAKNCSTLLVSSEHLHSRLQSPAVINRLKVFLDRWVEDYSVIVYFRRQDRVAISLNSTRIKSGAKKVDVGLPTNFNQVPRYYRYDRIHADWLQVFGEKSVEARLYQEKRSGPQWLLEDFCETLGLRQNGKVPVQIHNPSLDMTGLTVLARLNQLLEGDEADEYLARRQIAVQLLSDRYSGKHYHVNRTQAKRFYELFGEVNARLREAAFPAVEGAVFDEDFSEYPEKVPEFCMDEQEVNRMAMETLSAVERIRSKTKPVRALHFLARALKR